MLFGCLMLLLVVVSGLVLLLVMVTICLTSYLSELWLACICCLCWLYSRATCSVVFFMLGCCAFFVLQYAWLLSSVLGSAWWVSTRLVNSTSWLPLYWVPSVMLLNYLRKPTQFEFMRPELLARLLCSYCWLSVVL